MNHCGLIPHPSRGLRPTFGKGCLKISPPHPPTKLPQQLSAEYCITYRVFPDPRDGGIDRRIAVYVRTKVIADQMVEQFTASYAHGMGDGVGSADLVQQLGPF